MAKQTWKRKYRWVLTVPDQDKEDWSAFHDGLYIGRVSRDRTSLKKGTFMWSGGCSEWPGFQGPMPHNGRKTEAWEAAKTVEDWYDEGLGRSGQRPALVAQRIGPLGRGGSMREIEADRWPEALECQQNGIEVAFVYTRLRGCAHLCCGGHDDVPLCRWFIQADRRPGIRSERS